MYCFFLGFYDWIFTLSVGIYCNYARKQKRHPVISNRVAHNKCYINMAKVTILQYRISFITTYQRTTCFLPFIM